MKFQNKVFNEVIGSTNYHDFTEVFCNRNICKLGEQDKTYYSDSDHLSITGSLLLTEKVKEIL